MKPASLPPSIVAALSEVATMADNLAATACDCQAPRCLEVAAVLNNLDEVSSAVTFADLVNAPAMLNSAARAYRESFPSDSLGWEDAGRLQTIASLIAAALPPPPPPPDNGTAGGLI